MTSLGKKMLSAFVEVRAEDSHVTTSQPAYQSSTPAHGNAKTLEAGSSKFVEYFDTLFSQANIPRPAYYEFSKMIEAMNAVQDEKARFCGVYAGLHVQGLNREKLLSTAADYLKLLEEDAANFNSTIDSTLQDRVLSKQKEVEEMKGRLQELSGKIAGLQNKISLVKAEINENEEKIEASTNGYRAEGQSIRNRILCHVEKIKEHIH